MINQKKIKQLQQMQSHIGAVEINSWMFPYVIGYRDRVPFFNIEETLVATQKALNFIQHVHKEKGTITVPFLTCTAHDLHWPTRHAKSI